MITAQITSSLHLLTKLLYITGVRANWWLHIHTSAVFKRALDLCLTLPAMILLAPLLALVALAVKLSDGGPALFWQTRVGQNGKPFGFPKFRSMRVHSQALQTTLQQHNQHGSAGVTFKLKEDPRITVIGRFLRRTSIDELPQLWCVLSGDMSLVGPRPALPAEVARYKSFDRQRLTVKPGLTCIWQVNGRSEVPFPQQVRMDIEYIRTRSIVRDLRLIGETFPAVLKGRGAY
jgi:lipopolysaccharide/colanic/teichoic acid biosynthesis glycosyltransferase